jgi:release factor glutamine methyltransferase
MLPTPDTSHVPYGRVYEPAEDSFLVLDTLSSPSEASFLQQRYSQAEATDTPSPLVLEVGPGSGVIIAFLTAHAQHIFGRADILTVAADVNLHACRATETTVAKAVSEETRTANTTGTPSTSSGFFLGALQADLARALRPKSVDVLVCNPPYVPTETFPSVQTTDESTQEAAGVHDADSHLLSLSYAGGKDGMEMTSRLVKALPDLLSARGCAYILLCAQNRPEEVKAEAVKVLGTQWRAETVGTSGKTAGWEQLVIVRIWSDEI